MTGDCTGSTWSPDVHQWEEIERNSKYVIIKSEFKWDDPHRLAELKNLGGNYQHEIKRSENYWDFVFTNWGRCQKKYWTNLPNATYKWSEEKDRIVTMRCLRNKIPVRLDEEAELKCQDVSKLQAGKWYYMTVRFERKKRDKPFTLTFGSEWCGSLPLCKMGRDFEWCTHQTVSNYLS